MPPPPGPMKGWIGNIPQNGAWAIGHAYTDGALKGTIPRAQRGGWAFVVWGDETGGSMWGMYGICAELYPTVLRTELRLWRKSCGTRREI